MVSNKLKKMIFCMAIAGGCMLSACQNSSTSGKPVLVSEGEGDREEKTAGKKTLSGQYKVEVGKTSFSYPADKIKVLQATDLATGEVDGDDVYLFAEGTDTSGVPLASIRVEYGNSGDLGELESDVKIKDWVFRDAGIYTFLANYSLDGKLSCGSSETYRFAMMSAEPGGDTYCFDLNVSEDGTFTEEVYNSIVEAMCNLVGSDFEVRGYDEIMEKYK